MLGGTVALCLAMLAVTGTRAAPARTVFHLPRDARPGQLALGDDGSVWAADDYDGVTRLGQDGRAKHYLSDDDFADDVVRGPDGAMWVAGDTKVIRIDAAGRTTALAAG